MYYMPFYFASFRYLISCYALEDPCMLPRLRVDKGAIRFVMSGANIMCPGVTHDNVLEGNKELGDLPVGTPVVRGNMLITPYLNV